MKNAEISTDKNGIMTIKVDTKQTFGPSKSGKTVIIASTEGNQTIDGVTIGLNVYKKA